VTAELDWYDDVPGTPPVGEWWWAVEHLGHPAYYLRALCLGDFAPGQRGPAPRHVLEIEGSRPPEGAPVPCGTCGIVPAPEDLEAIERSTGSRGFLDVYRSGQQTWPPPTDLGSCWECSDPRARAERAVKVARVRTGRAERRVCNRCAEHLARRGTDVDLDRRR
jgi:hypothetical protein